MFSLSEKIIVPSYNTKKIFSEYYPEIEKKIQVIEHGTDVALDKTVKTSEQQRGFRVAFIGGINESKGSQVIYDLIKKSDASIQWYIFGAVGDRNLLYLEKKNFHKMGPYEREKLPELLYENGIDLIGILSMWRETFCYTLSEAIASRIPILASDVGALGERVKRLQCGWVIEDFRDSDGILEKIYTLKNRGEEYQNCIERIGKMEIRTVRQMIDDYSFLYHKCEKEDEKEECNFDKEEIYRGFALASGRGIDGLEISDNILERLNKAETSLYLIYNSTSYKLINKLKELPIPGKSFIKLVLYKVYKRNR